MQQIPQGARLEIVISACSTTGQAKSFAWDKLMCFASEVFKFPDKQPNNYQQVPLTTLVKRQARSFKALEALPDIASIPERKHDGRSATDGDKIKKKIR